MGSFLHFLQYNNAVPIALAVVFLGAGGVFAATNPETLYRSESTAISIDNTYIAGKDLSSYTPQLRIMGVTEDAEIYYVSYELSTIDIVDAIWQDVVKKDVLKVHKSVLGEYGDLGLYATEQFKQIVDREASYLREVQEIEKKNVTQKVVATAYAGLVGALLDTTTETIPGYVPVVLPPEPEVPMSGTGTTTQSESAQSSVSTDAPPVVEPPTVGGSASTSNQPPSIQLLGESVVRIPLGGSYADLGVVVSNDDNHSLAVYVNDESVALGQIAIDTTVVGSYRIRYVAIDSAGAMASIEREVIVFDPALVVPETQVPVPDMVPPEPEPEPVPETIPETPVEPLPEEALEVAPDTAPVESPAPSEPVEIPQESTPTE